jgi:hypothetical protein
MTDRQHCGANKQGVVSDDAAEMRLDQRSSTRESKGENLGLCANCELRETCEKPKLPGGIWFCNDYSEL